MPWSRRMPTQRSMKSLESAKSRGEAPLIVICDELSDPHNLGAIIRTAECAGAHGVIIPKAPQRRSDRRCGQGLGGCAGISAGGACGQSGQCHPRAAKSRGLGASVQRQTAIRRSIRPISRARRLSSSASEGEGMGRLGRRERATLKSVFPCGASTSSLNASNAAAILLYEEAVRQRG